MRSTSTRFFRKKLPSTALLLDFDETIAIPDKNAKGEYIVREDGSIGARIMDKTKLARMVNLSIFFQVPIHIVTARADIPGDKEVVYSIIDSVDGFHKGVGGFKREYVHFCSIKPNGEWKQIKEKEEVCAEIHGRQYSYLDRKSLLFVDDMVKYLEGVKKAGFSTFQANPETKEHYAVIEKCIITQGHSLNDLNIDSSLKEMVDSAFGQQSNTAKRLGSGFR